MQARIHRSLAAGVLALLAITASAAPVDAASPGPPIHPEFGASVDIASRQMNPPRYPSEEARAGISGTTVLVVHVQATGVVSEVFVEKSSGNRNLDKAAIDAARTWRFNPGSELGKAVPGRVRVPVIFDMGASPLPDMSLPLPMWDETHPILTGAVECDTQLNRLLACANGKLAREAFEVLLRNADLLRRNLTTSTEQKQLLSQHCAADKDAHAARMIAMGCEP